MKVLTVKVPETYVAMLDRLVQKGIYTSRSDAVRDALRMLFEKYKFELEGEPIVVHKKDERIKTIDIGVP